MTAFHSRELTSQLHQTLAQFPVVVLSGLRQCGKSTLLTLEPQLASRTYLALDDFAVEAAAQRDPAGLLASPDPLTFDEVQRVPDLLRAIKSAVDRDRRAGRFLLSGSANLALMARVSETLAGRAVYLTLHPMTRREIQGLTSRPPGLLRFLEDLTAPRGSADPIRADEILLGGLPPACLEHRRGAGAWFRGYVQTYVERDLRQLSQVTDLVAFRTLV